jgi:5-methylcytosine-specific restriction endonuclease McrA
VIRRVCVHRSRSCSGGGYALPGTSRCRAHTTNGWGSKKNKAARDANYVDPVYRRNRAIALEREPVCHWKIPGVCTGRSTTADHLLAVSLGGDNSLGNLVGACRRCNEARGRDLGNAMKRRRPK